MDSAANTIPRESDFIINELLKSSGEFSIDASFYDVSVSFADGNDKIDFFSKPAQKFDRGAALSVFVDRR
jgi:hypothetical protein